MFPKISVIVPIYNSSKYLDRCIKSIIEQTYADIEIILVDDGSQDNSIDICKRYASLDSRIKILSQENQGVSVARNAGLKVSTGEYVMLLDSDDWWDATMCEVMYNTVKQYNADCVVCGFRQTSGNIWAPAYNKAYHDHVELQQDFVYWLNTELLSSSVNKIYSRKKIKHLYPEDMSFGEDLVFSLQYLTECNRVVFIQDALYLHEVFNCVSLTHTFNPVRFSNLEKIQDTILSFSGEHVHCDPLLYKKYIYDVVLLIRRFVLQDNISRSEKKIFLRKWLMKSYLRQCDLSKYQIHWKNRLLLICIKKHLFLAADWIVNGKKRLLHFRIK